MSRTVKVARRIAETGSVPLAVQKEIRTIADAGLPPGRSVISPVALKLENSAWNRYNPCCSSPLEIWTATRNLSREEF